MKRTFANKMRLLKVMSQHSLDMWRLWRKEGNTKLANKQFEEHMFFEYVIRILENPKDFDEYCKIFKDLL